MSNTSKAPTLERKLGPWSLWGLGVGYVISGMYFGWNLGLDKGGTLGLALATLAIIVMYLAFTFCYTELACAIPKAGGAFTYATRAFGKDIGFLAGIAQVIEFVFAPPSIAFAIGAYFQLFFPGTPIMAFAILAYVLFTILNISGVKMAARFELVITIFAVFELLVFFGATIPSFEIANLTANPLPNGIGGAFAAIPFAIWFFLAIEGVANVAEETVNPQRNVLIGFGSAILTLVALAVMTFVGSVGVGGWESIVYTAPGVTSDSPLPLALKSVMGDNHFLYHMLIFIGLFGLVASFHGIILASGRAMLEMGRARFLPPALGAVSPRFKTPAVALVVNLGIGLVALFTGRTADIITLAVFGALTLYIVSLAAHIKLRTVEPSLPRPFKIPLYPAAPLVGLTIAVIALAAVTWYNLKLAGIYLVLLVGSYAWFRLAGKSKSSSVDEIGGTAALESAD
jgi:ethanolamine permease